MLKEAEETLFTRPLLPARAERLKIINEGCDKVLVDLQSVVRKYNSLGTQGKRTWDRMKWGNEDITEIRARLTSNVTMLAAFISTSQITVENKLDSFIEEFRQGRRETSVVSLQTVDSLSADDRAVWRTIRKELEDMGISVAAFDANRNFIYDWFVRAVETGAFEERIENGVDEESSHSEEEESWSSDGQNRQDKERQIEHTDSGSLASTNKTQQIFSARPTPKNPWIAALLAGMSRPKRRLLKAIKEGLLSQALGILTNEVSFRFLDKETLNKALYSTSGVHDWDCDSDPCSLIAELIARGGNVNYISRDVDYGETPLYKSIFSGSIGRVRLLVQNGADVNYKDLERGSEEDICRHPASAAVFSNTTHILRFLLSSGVDVNATYEVKHSFGFATLLHEAAALNRVSAIEELLEFGANIDAESSDCGTPLMLALSYEQEGAAEILLDKGANPNFKTLRGQELDLDPSSPIEAATRPGSLSLVELLLEHGAVSDDSTLKYAKDVRESYHYTERRQKIVKLLESRLQVM